MAWRQKVAAGPLETRYRYGTLAQFGEAVGCSVPSRVEETFWGTFDWSEWRSHSYAPALLQAASHDRLLRGCRSSFVKGAK
jgi:hypothetical protein